MFLLPILVFSEINVDNIETFNNYVDNSYVYKYDQLKCESLELLTDYLYEVKELVDCPTGVYCNHTGRSGYDDIRDIKPFIEFLNTFEKDIKKFGNIVDIFEKYEVIEVNYVISQQECGYDGYSDIPATYVNCRHYNVILYKIQKYAERGLSKYKCYD